MTATTKRVLLTGASGFVGRPALAHLRARGYEVHAVSRTPRASAASGQDDTRWHVADLLSPGTAEALVAAVRPTHLLHLAWYVEHGAFWRSPENLRWVGATLDLTRAFADGGGRRAVFAGTCAEYDWHAGECREGVTPERPDTLYGASKLALHDLIEMYTRQVGISSAWGRVFLLYGPNEAPARLVPSVVRSLLAGTEARCSHGEQRRDFLHVDDVASAFVAMLDGDVEGTVNIAAGAATRVRDVVDIIAEHVGRPDLVRLGAIETPLGDPPVLIANAGRLRDEVRWSPRYDLHSGLADTVAWWAAQQAAVGRHAA